MNQEAQETSALRPPFTRSLSLFLISLALIAYELSIIRVFSVTSWSNFGSMVISIALLGFGLAGTLLTFLQKRIKKNREAWLTTSAALLPFTMAFSLILAVRVPFNPVLIASNLSQLWWIALYYVLFTLPFFTGALFIGISFTLVQGTVHHTYFWNMLGSGLGGFVLLGLLYVLPVEKLIYPILGIAFAGAFLSFFGRVDNRIRPMFRPASIVLSVLLIIATFLGTVVFAIYPRSVFKDSEQAKLMFKDLQLVHYSSSPFGEMEVYKSSMFHFAPGLSDNAAANVSAMPRNAYWGLYVDGNGPISIMRQLKPGELKYIDYLPMSAPYGLLKDPDVLLIKLGGGFTAFTALYNGAKSVTIVEPNKALADLMRHDRLVTLFNDDLLSKPKINLVQTEPRAYSITSGRRYDLVEISLIDSVGLSQSVGNPLDENYLYTVEAFKDYLKNVEPGGFLSITSWNHLAPPRNMPKLIATIIQALKETGAPNPEKRLYIFAMIYSTSTILVKNGDFTPAEIETLKKFTYKLSFDDIYYSGIKPKPKDLSAVFGEYTEKYNIDMSDANAAKLMDGSKRKPEELYYHITDSLLAGKDKTVYDGYLFNIEPSRDDKPYFNHYLKASSIGMFADKLDTITEEWNYLLMWGTFFQALFFGLLIIVIPIFGKVKSYTQGKGGAFGVILYYGCLGIGYMLVEIVLIQKLTFFLADPIFSVGIVITTMLVLSGVGSLVSSRFKAERRKRNILIAAACILISLVCYAFLLSPVLTPALGLPLPVKILISILVIAPSAFFMGMPFPTGLSSLGEQKERLLPWAWGVNGALSVSGSVLARVISVHWGFTIVLLAAAGIYLAAGLLFPINLRKEKVAVVSETRIE